MNTGILYIVATPIGNLQDFTFRALEILKSVDVIACEDTRITQKLLNHYGISTKTISYHKFSERERSGQIIGLLTEGKNIALVTDAGTPLISDPGSILIDEAAKHNIKVIPVPGVSAVITALSSVPNDGTFAFCGFFPQKNSEAVNVLRFVYDFNCVFYESPNRILKTLYFIKENLPEIKVSIARELTKIHEDITTKDITAMINYLENSVVKGEIVLIIHKQEKQKENIEFENYAQKLLNEGYSQKDCVRIISTLFDIKKNDIYKKICK